MQQGGETGLEIAHGAHDGDARPHIGRQEQLAGIVECRSPDEFVLKFAVQRTAGVLRDEPSLLSRREREGGKRRKHGAAHLAIFNDGVLRAVIDLDRRHAVHGAHGILQQVCLPERHPPDAQMHTQAALGFM